MPERLLGLVEDCCVQRFELVSLPTEAEGLGLGILVIFLTFFILENSGGQW